MTGSPVHARLFRAFVDSAAELGVDADAQAAVA